MIRFKVLRNTYTSQLEGNSLFVLRLGYTAYCLFTEKQVTERRKRPWWYPFPLNLTLWSHSAQMGQYHVFKVKVGKHALGWKTKGECKPHHSRYYERGLSLTCYWNKRFHSIRLIPWSL